MIKKIFLSMFLFLFFSIYISEAVMAKVTYLNVIVLEELSPIIVGITLIVGFLIMLPKNKLNMKILYVAIVLSIIGMSIFCIRLGWLELQNIIKFM